MERGVTMSITVGLVDDHRIILDGLQQLFTRTDDIEVVGTATDGAGAIDLVRRKRPAVLVLDVSMPGVGGMEVLKVIHEEKLPTRVILLTAAIEDDRVVEAMRLGVWGLVLKEAASVQLVRAVRRVALGTRALEESLVGRAVERMSKASDSERELAALLSPRETEVVRMVAQGLRNKEIADQLALTEGTVKSYLHTIYEKLDVRGRVELTLYAQEKGLV
ncbi:MAG: response regulator transcription factor [Acidobacteria bacterium]|nr:response regulator transcription factor [Acidobacteriota bacterium]